jgi:thymidylate synthase (FAD)
MKLINKSELYNDNIGFIEQYDFSTANRSYEDRVKAISSVASICYNSTWNGTDRLFKKLGSESKGLPSSSYEMCPILLSVTDTADKVWGHATEEVLDLAGTDSEAELNIFKYGEFVENGNYLLTNLRALIADIGDKADQFYNTDERDIALIKKHYKVFKTKIPLFVARQYMRHRVSWQELSRRYVSGNKQPFEFYLSESMKHITSAERLCYDTDYDTYVTDTYSTKDIFNLCIEHYLKAVDKGVKPQDARGILPQTMYTEIWSAWYPKQLESFINLRVEAHAQNEIRELALTKQKLLKEV